MTEHKVTYDTNNERWTTLREPADGDDSPPEVPSQLTQAQGAEVRRVLMDEAVDEP